MTDHELGEALVWLYAVDCGLVRGGDCPATLRSQCRQAIRDRLVRNGAELNIWISRLVREVFLSDAALDQGHGIDEAADFWSWFDHTMWTCARHVDGPAPQAGTSAGTAESAAVHPADIPGRIREAV